MTDVSPGSATGIVDGTGFIANSKSAPNAGIPPARYPWTDSRFWVLQLVVLALALIRLAVTVAFNIAPDSTMLEASTFALFVVPVVIASLDYGLSGGITTVSWVIVLDAPRFIDAHGIHQTGATWEEGLEIAVLAALAVIIGHRVSAETISRDEADAAREGRLRAERLYRDMFESNQSPILIVDADGYIVESNASANRTFGGPGAVTGRADGPDTARARRLVDVVGPDAAAIVLAGLVAGTTGEATRAESSDLADTSVGAERIRPVAFEVDGQPVLLRPTATLVGRTVADRRMQVIFADVTTETRRHDLMEAFASQVVLGQEEERRHIAQELHDGPLQTLIHLCRQIDALETESQAGERPDPLLSSMRSAAEDTVAELRSIARGLRPSVLDDLGLVASINQVLMEASEREGFDCKFDVDGNVRRISPVVELALFRIAQEAITNVCRHAGAKHVTVTIGFTDGGARVTVEDDGVGFDRVRHLREDDGQSLGLPGMAERARLVGGRVNVRSQIGAGTTVTAWLSRRSLEGGT